MSMRTASRTQARLLPSVLCWISAEAHRWSEQGAMIVEERLGNQTRVLDLILPVQNIAQGRKSQPRLPLAPKLAPTTCANLRCSVRGECCTLLKPILLFLPPTALIPFLYLPFPFPLPRPSPSHRKVGKQASKQARIRTGRHCNAHPLPQSFQPACGLSPHLAPQSVACTRCPHRTAVFYNSIPASKAPPGRLGQGSSSLTAA